MNIVILISYTLLGGGAWVATLAPGTGLYGCVILTPVDTRTCEKAGAHGTGRTKSSPVRFGEDKYTR